VDLRQDNVDLRQDNVDLQRTNEDLTRARNEDHLETQHLETISELRNRNSELVEYTESHTE
jgi:hypothetical protein